MNKRFSFILSLLLMVSLFASGVQASDKGKLAATHPRAPKVAEPNPSWQDQYPDYYKVRMASATDGWIVGAEGAIRRYAGGQWVAYASPVTTTLRSVYPISNTAFAVGDNSAILQFIGDAWQTTAAPSGCTNFRDVWMLSSSDGWAVGGTCEMTPTGVIAHYNGTSWQNVSVPYPLPQMNALQMLSANEGWFVGNNAALLHYLNGNWQAYNAGITSDIYSIAMLPDGSEGWAGISDLYCDSYPYPPYIPTLHYVGGVWGTNAQLLSKSDVASPDSCFDEVFVNAYGVAALSERSRWYVGSYHSVNPLENGRGIDSGTYSQGALAPNQWYTPTTNLAGPDPLYSIYMVSVNDVWAVGTSGYIEHYDGANWQQISGAPLAVNSLDYNPAEDKLYQAGSFGLPNGGIMATSLVDGHPTFSCTTSNATWKSIASLHSSARDTWAVGVGLVEYSGYGPAEIGEVAHITDAGCAVSTIITGTYDSPQASLNSVIAVSPTLAIAVGSSGTLAVYTGTWITLTLGTHNLNGIAYKSGRYWVVGDAGTAYTTVGDPSNVAGWTQIAGLDTDDLNSVSPLSDSEAWIVGNMARYHVIVGGSLTRQTSNHNLSGIAMLSPTSGWAVGFDGGVERYDGSNWTTVAESGVRLRTVLFTSDQDGWAGGNQFTTDHNQYNNRVAYNIPDHLLHFAPACYDYYSDVPDSYYARRYILDLSCRGIVSGMGNHVYAPDANTTRIQFAKIISLARGWQLITPTTPTFSDVPTSNPLYSFVETAYANHALSGASPATCQARGLANPCFLPNDAISRAQAVIITVRAFGWPTNTSGGPHFSDVPVGSYAYEAVETAYNRGVVNGIGNGTFGPGFNVSRAQIAKIVDLAILSPLASLKIKVLISSASATNAGAASLLLQHLFNFALS